MAGLEIRNLNPGFGVEVLGLEPKTPLDEATRERLKTLFDERSLLVFRDIDADLKFQTYLSEMLIGGDVSNPDAFSLNKQFFISNKEEKGGAPYGRLMFHSDSQWRYEFCYLISLYGADVGQPSTPTLFVSSIQGWDTLPENLRAKVKDRFAIHRHDEETYKRRAHKDPDVLVSSFSGDAFSRFPIVFRHPRTGRTLLYVSQQMTSEVADMEPQESEDLLEALFAHLYKPENILEHHWRQGDLVVWDNVALQHARPNVNTEGPPRTLRKVFSPSMTSSVVKAPEYSRAGAQERA